MKTNRYLTTVAILLTSSLSAFAKNADKIPGATVQDAAFFTGKPYDADLESYVFNYRNYNAEAGRWTTTDPSGFPDGANSYSYITNQSTSAFDATGLVKTLVTHQIDSHVPNCYGWELKRGDGSDWKSWYEGNGSVFFQNLGADQPKPTVASLAISFCLSKLGLTASGANSPTWTSYGGDIEWRVYKDIQSSKTVWSFEYTATKMVKQSWSTGYGGILTGGSVASFTPSNASGTLTATVE